MPKKLSISISSAGVNNREQMIGGGAATSSLFLQAQSLRKSLHVKNNKSVTS
jgi:hypothetical protein